MSHFELQENGHFTDTVKCLTQQVNTKTKALIPIEGARNTRNGGLN